MALMRPTVPDLLELDIDTRLAEVWFQVWAQGEWSFTELGPLLRFAYGRGYSDALSEPERGQLCRDHGFVVPARRRTA
jgi:hypothetical protein